MQIHELPTISGSPSGGYFATDNGTQTTKIDYTALAQAIIEQYNASTLAGTAQSVKAALDKISPSVKTAISDLSTINPGEQGYFQFTADVSPTGEQAYFTVWCTGNNERRGLIAIYTVSAVTRIFANSGHAQSGTVYWRGWHELAKLSDTYTVGFDSMTRLVMNDDLNTYTKAGSYIATSTGISSTLLNSPISDSGFSLHIESVAGGTGQYIVQTAKRVRGGVNVAQVFTRIYTGSAWGAWVENPSRAEVDALRSNLAGLKIIPKTLAVGGSVTFTSTTVAHYVVFVCGAGGQRCAVVVRGASATGYTILSDANGTSNITVSASGRDLTITSADTASAEAGVYAVVFSGTVS